jgi:DNA-binding NtrC family response regulator
VNNTHETPTPIKGTSPLSANILIIEDDPDTAAVIATSLIKEGYGARTVENRDEALKVLNQTRYDLIVMDLYMPGMGPELFIMKVHSKYPRSKVILITATENAEKQARSFGISHSIGKPFDHDQLLAAVRKCLS